MCPTPSDPRKSQSWARARLEGAGGIKPAAVAALVLSATVAFAGRALAQDKAKLVAAVASFSEPREYQHRALGLRAALWVHKTIADSGRWQMVPRDRALALERRLGLSAPLQAGELQRIGTKLMAQLVVSGAVSDVRLDRRRRSVKLAVRIELTDVATGELLAAANAEGRAAASGKSPQPTDVIVEQALAAACDEACRRLLKPPVVCTRIAKKTGRTAYQIAAGRQAGLTKGRKCLVLRHEGKDIAIVGVVIVQEVADASATAVVLSQIGRIKEGDEVVAP